MILSLCGSIRGGSSIMDLWPRLTGLAIDASLRPNQWKFAMNVHLTAELEQLVQAKVRSGRYNSASEVVREALRLMEQKDEVRSIQLQELRSRIDNGLRQADRSEGADGDEFMRQMIEDLDTREVKRKAGSPGTFSYPRRKRI